MIHKNEHKGLYKARLSICKFLPYLNNPQIIGPRIRSAHVAEGRDGPPKLQFTHKIIYLLLRPSQQNL